VDRLQGNEREVVGKKKGTYADIRRDKETGQDGLHGGIATDRNRVEIMETKGTSEYEGWGTALKPAHEPIVMARKPFKGSVAENVLEHGTGGINIDGCRVGTDDNLMGGAYSGGERKEGEWKEQSGFKNNNPNIEYEQPQGRFPANVMHDGSDVVLEIFPDDSSRFFYCAKANRDDRNYGAELFEARFSPTMNDGIGAKEHNPITATKKKNTHPTVKPTELMRYLCRLVTPKGGVVLDPFMGSGSTGKGALLEGFKFIGIEVEREYFDIACARLEAVQKYVQATLF
jgi:site-specific DNA-methyltransferase (adenine-specific)